MNFKPSNTLELFKKIESFLMKESSSLCNQVISSNGKDIKVAADRQISEGIKCLLAETRIPVICEEDEHLDLERLASKDFFWLIDPLDGSLNFSRGVPFYCCSVSLFHKGFSVLGYIYDFNSKSSILGINSRSQFYEQNILYKNFVPFEDFFRLKESTQAIVATGFPSFQKITTLDRENFFSNVTKFKKVRLFGSSCFSLKMLFEGKIDAYCEKNIRIWDVAAGMAMAEAVGYPIEWCCLENISFVMIKIASNEKILENIAI